MKDSYGLIAPYYNQLAKLVFGKSLQSAKLHFATQIERKNILIIGGGDGIDYKKIQSSLHGQYWELSESMLNLARVHLSASDLDFQLGSFQPTKNLLFDEVWLHFVLDTFNDSEIHDLLLNLRKVIKPEGKIYLADFFSPQNLSQKILHRSMISFFRMIAQHKRKNIPDYEMLFKEGKWMKLEEKVFLKGWVKAQIWGVSH